MTMTMKHLVPLAGLLLVLLMSASPLQAQEESASERPLLIVLPLEDSGVGRAVADSLSDLLVLEVERVRLFTVLAQKELQDMLRQVANRQLMGVESDEELAAVGAALQASFVLRGSVGRVGATYLLTLSLLDVKQARSIRRVEQRMAGNPDGLLGSLNSAVLALALEEEGVAPDLTAGMIDSLNIARKPKTLFARLGLGYELPVGPMIDSGDLAYLLPGLMTVNVSAGYHVRPYLQLVFETGLGMSIAEHYAMQNKMLYVRKVGDQDAVSQPEVRISDFDYQVWRVPLHVMARFQPSQGRLLPFAQVGLGASWQRTSVGDEHIQLLHSDTPCAEPFRTEGGRCLRDVTLSPERKSIDYVNLHVPVSFGVDYLLSHNWGIGFELRYLLTYSLDKNDRDLDLLFTHEAEPYLKGGESVRELVGDTVPIRRLHHGIGVLAGVFYYF